MKKRYKRTAKQYREFRKAFAKWSVKYKSEEIEWVDVEKVKGSLQLWKTVDGHDNLITEYIAPDYTKYMSYVWRKFI